MIFLKFSLSFCFITVTPGCYYLTNDNYLSLNRLVKKIISLLHSILLFGNVNAAVSEHVLRSHEMYAINMLTHVVEEGTYVLCCVVLCFVCCSSLS